ncbi:hypothetical protein [Cohnella caldifontis]|uniref:hypothetical protein n=1 Tax=Cohnella caldifontis TaxID=3027471 RepID=UPI0023EA8553|nr:hypothetical protein [Cohnella sp. YIM B05605]
MKAWLGKGWDMTVRHKYVGLLLFLYRLLWGFFLFRLVDSVVTPILARYPDLHPNANAIPIFLIEAEFRLLRTDLMDSLLWLLAGLLILRMIISPVIDAGLFYSFHHAGEGGGGTRMLAGIRSSWKPVVLLYAAENALILLPALRLIPMAKERFLASGSAGDWLQDLLPYAAGWLVWGFAVHLAFRCMQFGAVSRLGVLRGMSRALGRAVPLLAVSLAMAGIGFAASAAVSAFTVVWSGFAAVVIHQSFHFVRSLLALWTAASQFSVWRELES